MKMISDIDYVKFTMSQERDKSEIDFVLRSKVWSQVLTGLGAFWSVLAIVVFSIWFFA
jgi:hypothetical protein